MTMTEHEILLGLRWVLLIVAFFAAVFSAVQVESKRVNLISLAFAAFVLAFMIRS